MRLEDAHPARAVTESPVVLTSNDVIGILRGPLLRGPLIVSLYDLIQPYLAKCLLSRTNLDFEQKQFNLTFKTSRDHLLIRYLSRLSIEEI